MKKRYVAGGKFHRCILIVDTRDSDPQVEVVEALATVKGPVSVSNRAQRRPPK